jgi:hypothetical protein
MKIKAWLLIFASFLFTFVTPLVSAYFLLAKRETNEKFIMGAIFWMVAIVTVGALVFYINRQFLAAKANVFKTIFKGVKAISLLGLLWFLLNYIDANITKLAYTVAISIGGVFIGKIFELIAVIKYKDYIQEVGVF